MKRCINLDWLEVYALEPLTRSNNAQFFREQGWHVTEREYGTRTYEEMFVLHEAEYDYKFIEVRRNPKQKGDTAILPINACHIRLTNRSCYYENAAQLLKQFLDRYGYVFVSIYRADIAMDFERFDSGDDPQKFVARYMRGKYSKINQAKVHAHGDDVWNQREWNSLSWGSKSSQISTKLYLKTKELMEVKDKPYIREAWFAAGLVDNPFALTKIGKDGVEYNPNIWRLEFSISSDVKQWFTIEEDGNFKKKRSFRNTLDTYSGDCALLVLFMSLQEHYFHFRKFKKDKKKYDCPRKVLFIFDTCESCIMPEHPSSDLQPVKKENRLLKLLKAYHATIIIPQEKEACEMLIKKLEDADQKRHLENPYSRIDLLALQQTVASKMEGNEEDVATLINHFKKLLKEGAVY